MSGIKQKNISQSQIGENLKTKMEEQGKTVEQLAQESNLSVETINNLLEGNKPICTYEIIMVANALGTSIDGILSEEIRKTVDSEIDDAALAREFGLDADDFDH